MMTGLQYHQQRWDSAEWKESFKDCKAEIYLADQLFSFTRRNIDYLMSNDINFTPLQHRALSTARPIHFRQLGCLKPSMWLNSAVIDCYLEIVTVAYKLGRGKDEEMTNFRICNSAHLDRLNIVSKSKSDFANVLFLYFPYNIGGFHWVVIVVERVAGIIYCIDPMNPFDALPPPTISDKLKQWLKLNSFGVKFDVIASPIKSTPRQVDGFSCGIFAVKFIEKIVFEQSLKNSFSSDLLQQYRNEILADICVDDGFIKHNRNGNPDIENYVASILDFEQHILTTISSSNKLTYEDDHDDNDDVNFLCSIKKRRSPLVAKRLKKSVTLNTIDRKSVAYRIMARR
jgi:hypothetical protein